MKIGIDIRNIGKQRTGDEVVFFNLTKELVKIDSENDYFLFTDTANKEIIGNIEYGLGIKNRDNFKIVTLSKSEKLFINKFIWNVWSLPNYLRKNPLDIYHTQYITPFFVSKKIKIVTHIHDISFKIYKKFIKNSDLFFLNILIPMSIKRSRKIIAVSKFTKSEIIKYYIVNQNKIAIIYNSADLIIDEKTNKRKIIKKYNLPNKYILCIGTLQPRKNISILVEAYAKIKNKIPEIKLVIAGNREAYNFDKKINTVINRYKLTNKDIIFTGFVDRKDKVGIYSLAHTLVAPSLYEGFGITPLEAMQNSIPVLVSNIYPHNEVCGDAVLYFNPKDLDELEKKLYNICINENLRKELVSLESDRVRIFSWKKSAKELLKIYKSLK